MAWSIVDGTYHHCQVPHHLHFQGPHWPETHVDLPHKYYGNMSRSDAGQTAMGGYILMHWSFSTTHKTQCWGLMEYSSFLWMNLVPTILKRLNTMLEKGRNWLAPHPLPNHSISSQQFIWLTRKHYNYMPVFPLLTPVIWWHGYCILITQEVIWLDNCQPGYKSLNKTIKRKK